MGVMERVTPACGTVSMHMSFVARKLLSGIHKDFSITEEYYTSRMTPTGSRANVAPHGWTRWDGTVAR